MRAVRARAANVRARRRAGEGHHRGAPAHGQAEAPRLQDRRPTAGRTSPRPATGVGTVATVHDVELMRDALPEAVRGEGRRRRRHAGGRPGDDRRGRPRWASSAVGVMASWPRSTGRPLSAAAAEPRAELLERVRFGPDGLAPAVVQDATTGRVLTLAWMSRVLELDARARRTWLLGRSRQEAVAQGRDQRQHPGRPRGGSRLRRRRACWCWSTRPASACHTGRPTCFHRPLTGAAPGDRSRPSATSRRSSPTAPPRPTRLVVHGPPARQGHRHRVQEGGRGGDRGRHRGQGAPSTTGWSRRAPTCSTTWPCSGARPACRRRGRGRAGRRRRPAPAAAAGAPCACDLPTPAAGGPARRAEPEARPRDGPPHGRCGRRRWPTPTWPTARPRSAPSSSCATAARRSSWSPSRRASGWGATR